MVSDCEELVGAITEKDGTGFKLYISVILHSTTTYKNVSELI